VAVGAAAVGMVERVERLVLPCQIHGVVVQVAVPAVLALAVHRQRPAVGLGLPRSTPGRLAGLELAAARPEPIPGRRQRVAWAHQEWVQIPGQQEEQEPLVCPACPLT